MIHDNPHDLLAFAKLVALEAGDIMLKYFSNLDKQVEIKHDTSPVTIADKLINQLVIERVRQKFPEHGVLAEEGSDKEDRAKLWVCDPIDGTKAYIQGIPTAMFSLAYVVDGAPQVAVMHNPFLGKLYSAIRGAGAYVGDTPIRVSGKNELQNAQIAGVTSYDQLVDRKTMFDDLAAKGALQLIVPGNVFKSSLVSAGFIDGYIFPGRSAHDVAAAQLIVEEAGGEVTNLRGENQLYNGPIYGAIVSNSLIHKELVALVQSYGPEKYVGY